MILRILIVEDEAVVARRLERLLRQLLGTRAARIDHADSVEQAVQVIQATSIDVLLLDLNLRGRSGFEILGDLLSRPFQTIIVSAHDDQAIRAFEYGVTDFVVKPFSEARLAQAMQRLFERDAPLRESMRHLAVRRAGTVQLIAIDQLRYLQGADDYSELHCKDGSSHLHDKSLTALAHLLPAKFIRLHRSYLVNLDCIRQLHSAVGSRYHAELDDGTLLPVGRARVVALRERLL